MSTLTDTRPTGTGRSFYGWRIVALCAVTLGMTAPGQTAGVSVFIDPMIAGLDLTRSQLSLAYLIGTLAGAGTMPAFGRLLDRRGVRFTMTVVGAAFMVVLAAMAGVANLVTLTLGFVGIRMLGQGALTMTSTTAVAYWFDRYRGRAVGLTAAGGQGLMTIAPVSLAAAVTAVGWRSAWVVAAVVVGLVTLAIARLGMYDSPAAIGQHVDGQAAPADHDSAEPVDGVPRDEAVRSRMFWALTGGVVATGLIGTGLSFHQISILGEQGLTPLQAAANFVPQTLAGLGATLGTGTLVDRVRPRVVLAASMATLAAAVLILPAVTPGLTAVVYGAALGAAGGSARALEAAAFPRLFGTRHLGSIRGVSMAAMVIGTALGPFALAVGRSAVGSYLPVLHWLLLLPAVVVVLGLSADVRQPTRPDGH
jgi:MFS family permease